MFNPFVIPIVLVALFTGQTCIDQRVVQEMKSMVSKIEIESFSFWFLENILKEYMEPEKLSKEKSKGLN